MLKKRVSRESKATHLCELLSTSKHVSTGYREGGSETCANIWELVGCLYREGIDHTKILPPVHAGLRTELNK